MASAVATLVRSEGLAERMGDILLQCSGGTPGAAVTGNLTVFLPVNITNRVAADGTTRDVSLTIDTGAGPAPAPVAGRVAGSSLTFSGVSFTVPASGTVNLRISNLRGVVNQLGAGTGQPIQVTIALSGSLTLTLANNPVTVALPLRGLLATFSSAGIRCVGSPLPATISLSNLFAAGTRFASTRVTEGFATAFQAKDASTDTGTRIIARFTGFPAGTRVFVPDAIAGSSAAEPTAGGDLGVPQSGGKYKPGSGTLLLARVLFADANGAGGILAFTPPPPGSTTVTFDSASEVSLTNGSGFVVYEVVDANPSLRDSAQFPAFLGIPQGTANSVASQEVSLAPVSSENTASVSAPIPRFAAVSPDSDCAALGDCDASFFPKLVVNAQPLQFSATAGGAVSQPPGYIPVQNQGGGILNWTATVTYKSGSGWITLEPASGVNYGSVRVFISPQKLAPGTYEATITIDAGPLAGSKSFPVTLVVSALPAPTAPPAPPAPPAPTAPPAPPAPNAVVSSVTNAANFRPGPLAPGSLATIMGSKLSGKSISVTFDGIPATLLYTSDDQINLQVPPELAGKTSAQMVVTVDGMDGAAKTVTLAPLAPAIFGALNQDNAVNSPAHAAPVGSVLQIFATGLPSTSGAIFAKIHDRDNLVPLYAGAAPGLLGVEQVNVAIPDDLPAMSTEVLVCAWGPANERFCSPPATITLGQ